MTDQEYYSKCIFEHCDMTDRTTVKILSSINEDSKNQALLELSSRLYDKISSKASQIDYGTIPLSKGDITKYEGYESTMETLDILEGLLKQYKEPYEYINIIRTAISNINARKDQFIIGYKMRMEFVIVTYQNLVLSIVAATSYMVTSMIDYIKEPNETFSLSINRVGVKNTRDNLLYQNLKRFNNSCVSKDGTCEFDKVLTFITRNGQDNLLGIGVAATTIASIVAVSALILAIIPFLKEIVYFFFYSRVKLSDYLNTQAALIDANVYKLKSSDGDESVIRKQEDISDNLKSLSNRIQISTKTAANRASSDIRNDDRKYSTDDLFSDSEPELEPRRNTSSSSLF